MQLHLASALLNINELFDHDDRRKSPDRSGIQMSTNKPSSAGRLVRNKSSCLMSGMYCRCRIVMLVEFDVSADKSSTESGNEGFKLTQLPASRRLARRQQRQQKTTGNDGR